VSEALPNSAKHTQTDCSGGAGGGAKAEEGVWSATLMSCSTLACYVLPSLPSSEYPSRQYGSQCSRSRFERFRSPFGVDEDSADLGTAGGRVQHAFPGFLLTLSSCRFPRGRRSSAWEWWSSHSAPLSSACTRPPGRVYRLPIAHGKCRPAAAKTCRTLPSR